MAGTMTTATITAPVEAAVTPKPAGKPLDRKILAIGIGFLAVGFVLGQGSGGMPLPWAPKQDRPILRAIARLAKLGLWVLVVEPVPDDMPDENQYTKTDTNSINHREGW